MADMITQCPKCSTTFHITEAHLNSAKGSVRCGSCLNVFNGKAHIKSSLSDDDDGLLISDDMDDGIEDDSPEIKPQIDPLTEEENAEPVDPDESWALELLYEEGHSPDQLGLSIKEEESHESETAKALDHDLTEQKEEHQTPLDHISKDEDKTGLNTLPNTLLDSIEAEPVEVRVSTQRSFFRDKRWLLLSIFAAVVLIIQLAWIKFEQWSVIEPYRQYYKMVCDTINCTLPEQKNLSKIRTSNLVVRAHPEKEAALIIDVILTNNAPFKQRFPSLRLTFKDLKNEVVASRTFSPDEYLAGELAGFTHMPKAQPIRIAIEIADPGNGAVSYNMSIIESL